MRSLFTFPNPVNEVAARVVAAGVVLQAVVTLVLAAAFGSAWLGLTAVIAYGFVARVLTGPTLSPLGRLATQVIAPRLGEPKFVPGPPKRFAQGIGAVVTTSAALAHFAFGADAVAVGLLLLIVLAATLESAFAICIGCIVFNRLMRAGVIPESVCESCNDISLRLKTTQTVAN